MGIMPLEIPSIDYHQPPSTVCIIYSHIDNDNLHATIPWGFIIFQMSPLKWIGIFVYLQIHVRSLCYTLLPLYQYHKQLPIKHYKSNHNDGQQYIVSTDLSSGRIVVTNGVKHWLKETILIFYSILNNEKQWEREREREREREYM